MSMKKFEHNIIKDERIKETIEKIGSKNIDVIVNTGVINDRESECNENGEFGFFLPTFSNVVSVISKNTGRTYELIENDVKLIYPNVVYNPLLKEDEPFEERQKKFQVVVSKRFDNLEENNKVIIYSENFKTYEDAADFFCKFISREKISKMREILSEKTNEKNNEKTNEKNNEKNNEENEYIYKGDER